MKLVKPSFLIKEQQSGIDGIYNQIEWAGRHCYKSHDRITKDSAKEFVDRMINSGHFAVLEQGTVYLKIPYQSHVIMKYVNNPYSSVNTISIDGIHGISYVTTNYRTILENGWLDDIKYLCAPSKNHIKRITVRFILDRGISHEFVRHRVFSFAQESSRFCCYSKSKFNNETTCIIPCWSNLEDGHYHKFEDETEPEKVYLMNLETGDYIDNPEDYIFVDSLLYAEENYLKLLKHGWKAQQARDVLPTSLKTELVMTGFSHDWQHFFDLRCDPSAHPQARELAIPLREEFIKRGLIQS